jgi:hypothetical protein
MQPKSSDLMVQSINLSERSVIAKCGIDKSAHSMMNSLIIMTGIVLKQARTYALKTHITHSPARPGARILLHYYWRQTRANYYLPPYH